jgi:hypothetical protein
MRFLNGLAVSVMAGDDLPRSASSALEAHAALTQALAAIVSVLFAAVALYFAVRSLWTLQPQTEANIAMTTETFRPIVEVQGGRLGRISEIDFVNKGNGVALNFRWRENSALERWRVYTTNVLAPQEHGTLKAEVDWKNGLVLGYNSVAHGEESLTHVRFEATGKASNMHEIRQGAAVTRLGWTLHDSKLEIPAWNSDYIRSLPLRSRLIHWWRLNRGKERRL